MSAPTSPTIAATYSNSNYDDAAPAPQILDDREPTTTPQNEGISEEDTHRCFICLVDEPDSALPADWVTPCKCSLEGHQSCLLTWVADLEAQGKSVKCPLCKSTIDVVDRWDPAVQLGEAFTRYLTRLSPMVLLSFIGGGAVMSSALYGMQALETFAGPETAMRFLFRQPESERYFDIVLGKLKKALPALVPSDTTAARDMLARENISIRDGVTVDWMHFFSLTLIAPALVLNRTTLGETVMIPSSLMVRVHILNASIVLYNLTDIIKYAMFLSDHKTDILAWPPTPQKVLLAFPVLRAIYFHGYRAVSKGLDRRLALSLLQSPDHQDEPAEQQQVARRDEPRLVEHGDGDDNFININFEHNLGDDDDAAAVEAAPAIQQQENDAPIAPPRLNQGVGGLSAVLNYFAGALMWPTVSYGAGSILRLVLPTPWVTKPASGPITGILQERWGRSLVGGCLFVVLKDAFFLYVKWRTTINRPYRRIKNVDRRTR